MSDSSWLRWLSFGRSKASGLVSKPGSLAAAARKPVLQVKAVEVAVSDEDTLAEARLLRAAGDNHGAIRVLDEALGKAERPALLQLALGDTYRAIPDMPAAEVAYEVAVTLEPDLGTAWLRLGEIQLRYERLDVALTSLHMAREHAVDDLKADTLLALAGTLSRLSRLEEARALYEEVLVHHPASAPALHGLASLNLRMGQEDVAVELFERAFAIEPSLRSRSTLDVASAFRQTGRWREALAMFEAEAQRLPPSPLLRWYTCQTRLALGEWAAGWDDYASRFAAGMLPYRPLAFKSWNGKPAPDGTLVVLAEQGLGDEIMFASCLPDVIGLVGHVVLECEPRLARLFGRSFPEATVLPTRREKDASWLSRMPSEPDFQLYAGDLPRFFRRQRTDFPQHLGYLKADPARVDHWRARLQAELGGGLRIGISWRGGTERTLQQRRSIPPDQWVPILQTAGCHFVSLQYGSSEAVRREMQELSGTRISHYPEAIDDYDETAALVSALDLVISVCTAVIHLSGALGQNVWILTPKVPEWRYTAFDTSLPWYPSSRIFRQPEVDAWPLVCQEVAQEVLMVTESVSLHTKSVTKTHHEDPK